MIGKLQVLVFAGRPFAKEDIARVFVAEVGAQSKFESTSEEHRRPRVLFLPAIEVSVAITSRAIQVLADLGVAVGHQDACASRLAGESSSHRLAEAKPSNRRSELPLKTIWLILTTPLSPTS